MRFRRGTLALPLSLMMVGLFPSGGAAFSGSAQSNDGTEATSASQEVPVPEELPSAPARAYLITIGVDAYESPEWNLRVAANSARGIARELWGRLEGPEYEEVVPVPLLSDQDPARSTGATSAAIRGVFDLLAGRDVAEGVRSLIPSADRLRTATAEDLVLISFSGRGYTSPGGILHLFPEDIGEGHGREVTEELLSRTVSSEDLARWLDDVDAGEMVLMIDSYHSAGAESAAPAPGAMESRALDQLASERGVRVLTASQGVDVAVGSDRTPHGLLTYALVEEGLCAGRADHEPRDGRITLGEWLRYATERTPSLHQAVLDGELQTFGRALGIEAEGEEDSEFRPPVLLDFRDTDDSILLAGSPPGAPPANVEEPDEIRAACGRR